MSSNETRMIMWVGYTINSNNKVVLEEYRKGARFINASIGAYYSVTGQSFTTDGINVYYDIKYKMDSSGSSGGLVVWLFGADGGHTHGTIFRGEFK